ncbi:MAG: cytochrome P450 [Cyanobacteria bacterium J06606_4]
MQEIQPSSVQQPSVQPPSSQPLTLPNPVALSGIRQLLNWLTRPYAYLDECAEAYGDTFTMNIFGFQPLVFFSDPKAIKDIFAGGGDQFDVGRGQRILQPLFGNNSLLILDGERHKRERKLLMPPFHGARVKSYSETICDITREISDSWQPGETILMGKVMPDITLEVILQTVFGLREGDRYQSLKKLLIRWLDLTGSPLGSSLLFFRWFQQNWGRWSPWGRVMYLRQQIYQLLQAEIDERRAQMERVSEDALAEEGGDDVLSLMLLARDEAGEPMTDEEIKDELVTMLAAGHETTATALSWAMYWIHKLPAVKARLMAELDALADDADPLAIAALPYLTAVVSETLRIYPVAPITAPRISNKETTINGQTFPPEVFLSPSIYSVHHREDLYPEPKKFRPERFLERQFSASEFIPFGGGHRRCIGYALAKLEMNLILATLLKKHTFALANDKPVTPQRRGIVIATSSRVPLTVDAN